MLEEVNRDTTALGGLAVFLVVTISSFLLGHELLAKKLFFGLIICHFLTYVIRFFYFKQRPDKQSHNNVVQKLDASSFPSLHSMRATVLAILLSLEFQNITLMVLFSASALSVYLTRLILKRHYFTDVLFGAIFGLIIGIGLAFTF